MKWFRPISLIRGWRKGARLRVRAPGSVPPPDDLSPRRIMIRIGMVVLVCLVVTTSLLFRPAEQEVPFAVGQEAGSTILSKISFAYDDADLTAQKRREAELQASPVFRVDSALVKRTDERMIALQRALSSHGVEGVEDGRELNVRTAGKIIGAGGEESAIESVRGLLSSLPPKQLEVLEYLAISSGKWEVLTQQVISTIRGGVASPSDIQSHFSGTAPGQSSVYVCDERNRKRVYAWESIPTPGQAARTGIDAFYKIYAAGMPGEAEVLKSAISFIIQPNLVFDAELTNETRKAAAAMVPMAKVQVEAGSELLRAGQVVQHADLVRLAHYQKQKAVQQDRLIPAENGLIFSLLFFLVFLSASYFLHAIHPEAVVSGTNVLLIGTVLILQVILNRFVGVWISTITTLGALALPVMLPLSFGSMLLANLVGLRVALWVGCVSSFATALHVAESSTFSDVVRFDQPFMLLTVGTISSFVAAVLMRRSRRRYHAVRTGLGVGMVTALVAFVFLVCMHVPMAHAWRPLLFWAFANGIFLSIVAAYVTPFFESVFGMTTDMTLLEMSDLNHPLLKQLQMEAPGTYHHSLTVATLAEECAAAIGANPLLARVCGYFHDIGKLVNAEYFTENSAVENPHEDLRPSLSNLVILNHVKCGLELAAKYKLQRPIREAISQHHGTSLVYYFYRRAVEQQQDDDPEAPPVGEHEYRYPGPLPVRKEIAILSVVDTCEAASRSLVKPTPQRIRALVEELVAKRVLDGQLEDADLTFSELSVVKETLIKSLSTMLHSRIRYPKEDEETYAEGDGEQEDDGSADSATRRAGEVPKSRG